MGNGVLKQVRILYVGGSENNFRPVSEVDDNYNYLILRGPYNPTIGDYEWERRIPLARIEEIDIAPIPSPPLPTIPGGPQDTLTLPAPPVNASS